MGRIVCSFNRKVNLLLTNYLLLKSYWRLCDAC